jgi:hypothetical protein
LTVKEKEMAPYPVRRVSMYLGTTKVRQYRHGWLEKAHGIRDETGKEIF